MCKQKKIVHRKCLYGAAIFGFSYPAANKFLRESSKLVLPHPYYLKSSLQSLEGLGSGLSSMQMKYLTMKCVQLSEHEKEVKLRDLLNESSVATTTLQVFLITSIFSKNKGVVGIFP